jgi:uncharacterized membrane protein YkvA (DUF1232 family)
MTADQERHGVRGLLGVMNVHHIVRLFLSLQTDRRVPWHLKVFAACGLVYVFSPLDILPDLFTGIGLLDDIIVTLIIMQSFMEFVPRHILDEHCERLKIESTQVFISVPQTIREARGLYFFAREFGAGFKEAASSAVRGNSERATAKGSKATTDPSAGGEEGAAASAAARYSALRSPTNGDQR